ncbi:unnamed protein product [Arabidopsis lyrata]|uniref:DUF241 domain-containing protein n=1 Tax=Arabidopsis lyrata subsp. lyrata TaxID=81972 RepID=D7MC50_ARALL|nr:uncharacterized protein LOC9305138 [Arabidopsis lyrata subsp. lyrata]EFH45326.1 hypothetical protein ARALYDRAFT_491077 [Arabidopsis lyrata subsp. lyrata]CAH8274209.1 unnamed protein product [Arabidopsis lyrata]|eukprot:XP_002869067.1 uncharacterized protein LOC9305138 [Arabidopsis lyrata subsp. lyrata]
MANMIIKKQLRSISLPSRSHPSTSGLEDALNKIKTITTGSSESILMGLAGLEELYNCMEDFLKMGSTQQVMSSGGSEFMEEMLDGSLRLMDICSVSRDLMVDTHEHVRGVQSCVRRKKVAGGGGDKLDVAVSSYVGFRKNMRKEAKKLLGSLKKINGGSRSCDNDHEDEHLVAVIDAMRGVISVSVVVLKSFLEFLSRPKSNIKSKLASVLKKKKDNHEATKNELETLDSAICGEISSLDDLQKELEEVEMSISGFERNLEGLFRRLIRTRASVLNIISH